MQHHLHPSQLSLVIDILSGQVKWFTSFQGIITSQQVNHIMCIHSGSITSCWGLCEHDKWITSCASFQDQVHPVRSGHVITSLLGHQHPFKSTCFFYILSGSITSCQASWVYIMSRQITSWQLELFHLHHVRSVHLFALFQVSRSCQNTSFPLDAPELGWPTPSRPNYIIWIISTWVLAIYEHMRHAYAKIPWRTTAVMPQGIAAYSCRITAYATS